MEKRDLVSSEQNFEYELGGILEAAKNGNETALYLRDLLKLAPVPAEPTEEVRDEQ